MSTYHSFIHITNSVVRYGEIPIIAILDVCSTEKSFENSIKWKLEILSYVYIQYKKQDKTYMLMEKNMFKLMSLFFVYSALIIGLILIILIFIKLYAVSVEIFLTFESRCRFVTECEMELSALVIIICIVRYTIYITHY